jgi:molecular chaperone GrpE
MSGPSNRENVDPEAEKIDTAAAPDSGMQGKSEVPEDGAGQESGAGPAAGATASAQSAEERILELEALLSEARDRHLRAHAEMENIRKRTEREKADISKYAITNFARDILNVSDNLRRAISAVSVTEEEHAGALKALLEGVQLTENELKNVLERHGVKAIVALGQQFDPNFHQAVMEQENKDVAAGSVIQVFQEGYQIGDRVLRPSMVVVAKGGLKPVKPSADADDQAAQQSGAEPGKTGNDGSNSTGG